MNDIKFEFMEWYSMYFWTKEEYEQWAIRKPKYFDLTYKKYWFILKYISPNKQSQLNEWLKQNCTIYHRLPTRNMIMIKDPIEASLFVLAWEDQIVDRSQ